jgi:methylmalonyl-CoA/ethylmalonyl-CoA epimerase
VHRLGSIHHVGIACRDLASTRDWVASTHVVVDDSGLVHDPIQDADLCLLSLDGTTAIELVSGPVVESLLRRGHSLYHLCYEVPSVEAAIEQLITSGCRLVSGPAPAVLFAGRRVAFLLGPTGLVELLEA